MNIVKQNKNNSRIFTKNFADFQNFKKFNDDRILIETNIWNFNDSQNLHGVPRCTTKNLGPIGSAVLTFIGYKQTDRQTDKPNLYIDKAQQVLRVFCVICVKLEVVYAKHVIVNWPKLTYSAQNQTTEDLFK